MNEIIKIIGIGLIALILIIIIKQYRPEFAIYISLIAGTLILYLALNELSKVIELLKNISDKCANKLYYGSWYVIYDITSELECQEIYRDIPIRNTWHI